MLANFKISSTALDLSTSPLMRLRTGSKRLNWTFVISRFPMRDTISIFSLSLSNRHWTIKTLSCTFNFNGLWDQVNALTEILFIGSKILFLLSGCIFSLKNSSERLLPNCLTVMRLSSISLKYNCLLMIFCNWTVSELNVSHMHHVWLLMQICFHFDAYCRTEITGDVSRMLLRYLFHEFPSFLWI